MTTLTPELAAAIEACRAALDQGDDSALLGWADALEEAGDPLAAALRWAYEQEARPQRVYSFAGVWHPDVEDPKNPGCCWFCAEGGVHHADLQPCLYGRLPRANSSGNGVVGPEEGEQGWVPYRAYPSRSDAYAALAQAASERGLNGKPL